MSDSSLTSVNAPVSLTFTTKMDAAVGMGYIDIDITGSTNLTGRVIESDHPQPFGTGYFFVDLHKEFNVYKVKFTFAAYCIWSKDATSGDYRITFACDAKSAPSALNAGNVPTMPYNQDSGMFEYDTASRDRTSVFHDKGCFWISVPVSNNVHIRMHIVDIWIQSAFQGRFPCDSQHIYAHVSPRIKPYAQAIVDVDPDIKVVATHGEETTVFAAHKYVLMNASTPLSTVIRSSQAGFGGNTGSCITMNFPAPVIEAFLVFLYEGRCTTTSVTNHARDLIMIADMFDVPVLSDLCVDFFVYRCSDVDEFMDVIDVVDPMKKILRNVLHQTLHEYRPKCR